LHAEIKALLDYGRPIEGFNSLNPFGAPVMAMVMMIMVVVEIIDQRSHA